MTLTKNSTEMLFVCQMSKFQCVLGVYIEFRAKVRSLLNNYVTYLLKVPHEQKITIYLHAYIFVWTQTC